MTPCIGIQKNLHKLRSNRSYKLTLFPSFPTTFLPVLDSSQFTLLMIFFKHEIIAASSKHVLSEEKMQKNNWISKVKIVT